MNWANITAVGFLAGALGTGLGGILALLFVKPTKKVLGFMLGLAAGVMLSIIFMELLDEALKTGVIFAIGGLLLGILAFVLLDNFFPHKHFVTKESKEGVYLKKGILIAIGIALHNLPEGIAIGAGFAASPSMGLTLTLLIALHNIPEGLAVAIPLGYGGMGKVKLLAITLIAGLPMGIGAFIGAIIGNISISFLGLSLGFAAGAMLYIVSDELIPDVYELTNAHVAIWGITSGVVAGILLIFFL